MRKKKIRDIASCISFKHATRNTQHIILILTCLSLALLAACTTAADEQPPIPVFPSPTPQVVLATPTLAGPLQSGGSAAVGDEAGPAPAPVIQTTAAAEEATVAAALGDERPRSVTEVPTATATSTATPIPDLPPAELLALGQKMLHDGQTEVAAEVFQKGLAGHTQTPAENGALLYWLGRAQMLNGHTSAAVEAFRQQLASAAPTIDSRFQLGELNLAAGNCNVALEEYQLYLAENPDLASYIWLRMTNCYNDPNDLVNAYEQALTSGIHFFSEVSIRQRLAALYRDRGDYAAALEQYAAVRDMAETEQTKGAMTYEIGTTYILSGSLESGYAAYQTGIQIYPRAYESYLGLVELVGAEQPVDAYQRGVVDYYAGAYIPAIEALTVYSNTNPTNYNPDTHLFLAWSYEGISAFPNALEQLDKFLARNPADVETVGTYYEEKAALETRSISVSQAITTLDEFVEAHPTHPRAAWASWRTAVLADRFRGDAINAAARYLAFAEAYPNDENAAEARYQAGVLLYQQGYLENAVEAWQLAAENGGTFGRAALVWLIDVLPEDEAADYRSQAAALTGSDYYTRRALDVAAGLPPYPRPETMSLQYDAAAEQQAAERWLAEQMDLESVRGDLSPELASDGRLIRGTKLWQLGAFDEGKQELEALRLSYADDVLASYQLAIYFRDLGLYRSSILAAVSSMTAAEVNVYQAPTFIARLAYPTYYADWVMPLAETYGYDPLLQFALIRQESLFEGFAASSAVAQGLTQVIPDTGIFIAQRLQWPDYSNDDLFRPYINLTFGAYYLDLQLRTFEDNTAAALAAYNAGPGNAQQWYEVAGHDHDLYLETVNFSETRLYIRNIYTWHAVYRYLYGEEG